MTTPTADPAPRRALVTLASRCDNRCIFCCQEGLTQQAADVDGVLSTLRADHDELTFVGGEPTLAPNLLEAVASARTFGFADIGLQTHGRHLGDVPRVRALIGAGLGHVHLSIHGATPGAHDYHTGIPGSFAEAAAALDVLVEHGIDVVVNTVLTRSNFRILAELANWLVRYGVSAWLCSWPRSAGAAATSFDRVMPRLGLAMPFVLHALQVARAGGLSVAVRGAPLCTLGPLGNLAVSDVPRTFAPACKSCPARADCSGIDALYLERFEDEELRSQPSPEPSVMPAEVVRRFVGTTAMAPPTPVEVHAAPAKARRRLPVLGKPAPGKGEARGRRGKSEGLDRLYPHLFETDPTD